jgi:hypothetical protein
MDLVLGYFWKRGSSGTVNTSSLHSLLVYSWDRSKTSVGWWQIKIILRRTYTEHSSFHRYICEDGSLCRMVWGRPVNPELYSAESLWFLSVLQMDFCEVWSGHVLIPGFGGHFIRKYILSWKEISLFYKLWSFIGVFTKTPRTLSWTTIPVPSFTAYFSKISLIVSSYQRVGPQSGLLLCGLLTVILYAFTFSLACAVYSSHFILDSLALIMLGEEYKLLISTLCNFLEHPTSSFTCLNILLSNMLSTAPP